MLTVKVFLGEKELFDCRVADSFPAKLSGIMFSDKHFKPLLIVFSREARRANAIHSLLCPEFDAVFLNSRKKIVDVKNVKPFQFNVVPEKPCKYLIEAPAGSAKGLEKGMRLKW